jgi:hypothetical protein
MTDKGPEEFRAEDKPSISFDFARGQELAEVRDDHLRRQHEADGIFETPTITIRIKFERLLDEYPGRIPRRMTGSEGLEGLPLINPDGLKPLWEARGNAQLRAFEFASLWLMSRANLGEVRVVDSAGTIHSRDNKKSWRFSPFHIPALLFTKTFEDDQTTIFETEVTFLYNERIPEDISQVEHIESIKNKAMLESDSSEEIQPEH